MTITKCPTCGSAKIKKVCRDVEREVRGQKYVVTGLEFYECPDCGEKVYERQAMQRIQAASPAYDRTVVKQ